MRMRVARRRALLLLCALLLLGAFAGLCSCGKPEGNTNNEVAVNAPTTNAAASDPLQDAKQAAGAAQAAAAIESQRQADQEKQSSSAATLQEAYDANPSSVDLAQKEVSQQVILTGSVKVKQGLNRSTQKYENVYMLVLPREVKVTGSKVADFSDDTVILDESYAPYVGKIASVRMGLTICVTSSIPSSSYSVIHAQDGYVVTLY